MTPLSKDAFPRISPPALGKVFVDDVEILPDAQWVHCIRRSAPETDSSEVVRMGEHFRHPAPGVYRVMYVWFGSTGLTSGSAAVEWCELNGLYRSSPYHIFATAQKHPKIQEHVGMAEGGPGMLATETIASPERWNSPLCACGVTWSRHRACAAEFVTFEVGWGNKTIFTFCLNPW